MEEEKFVADSMLGRLAKWLRVLGYDTHYQARYQSGQLYQLTKAGRMLLTRKRQTSVMLPTAIVLNSERVGEQMAELRQRGLLKRRPTPFSRCIRCNTLLAKPDPDTLNERVPEYVIYRSANMIRQCPTCGRFFWPGSHKERMKRQLHLWGINL